MPSQSLGAKVAGGSRSRSGRRGDSSDAGRGGEDCRGQADRTGSERERAPAKAASGPARARWPWRRTACGGALRWAGPGRPGPSAQEREPSLPRGPAPTAAPTGRTSVPGPAVGEGRAARPSWRTLPFRRAAAAVAGGGQASGCGHQPAAGAERPPTHLGAARRDRLGQTGKPNWLARPSVPHPPRRQLTIFLPAVRSLSPSLGPL